MFQPALPNSIRAALLMIAASSLIGIIKEDQIVFTQKIIFKKLIIVI